MGAFFLYTAIPFRALYGINRSNAKIAKKLNSNENAVKQLKLRAVLSLRRYMEE